MERSSVGGKARWRGELLMQCQVTNNSYQPTKEVQSRDGQEEVSGGGRESGEEEFMACGVDWRGGDEFGSR
jgi:hypothetical protein